jgi:hypothetical protein
VTHRASFLVSRDVSHGIEIVNAIVEFSNP